MKPSKAKLIDAMGELIYAVALADGRIQQEEKTRLHEILQAHPWAGDIEWSFAYERAHRTDMAEAFEKAISVCKAYGPTKEYAFLVDVLKEVAKASDGITTTEVALIDRFQRELMEHFQILDLSDLDEG